jgi:hypothetical protein
LLHEGSRYQTLLQALAMPTPQDDREVAGRASVQSALPRSAATGRIDLLSVLAHEMGHAIGPGHAEVDVMDELLHPGQRTTPAHGYAAAPLSSTGSQAAAISIDWSALAFGEPARASDEPASIAATAAKAWRRRLSMSSVAHTRRPNRMPRRGSS